MSYANSDTALEGEWYGHPPPKRAALGGGPGEPGCSDCPCPLPWASPFKAGTPGLRKATHRTQPTKIEGIFFFLILSNRSVQKLALVRK